MKKDKHTKELSEKQLDNVQGGGAWVILVEITVQCLHRGCCWSFRGTERSKIADAKARHTAAYGHDDFLEDFR